MKYRPGFAGAEKLYGYDLPAADARGDFSGPSRHEFWEVTDPDPAGLNARKCPVDVSNLPNLTPGADILKLPVVKSLPRGTEFVCKAVVKDNRNRPWFAIRTVKGYEEYYLVRASKDYIKPIPNPAPVADDRGNYDDDLQRYWEIVDPDPAGLNVRLHPDFPYEVGNVTLTWPESPPDTWPVISSLPRGTLVRAVHGHRGNIVLKGSDGQPWMLVDTKLDPFTPASDPKNVKRGFIRSNARYVKPVWP